MKRFLPALYIICLLIGLDIAIYKLAQNVQAGRHEQPWAAAGTCYDFAERPVKAALSSKGITASGQGDLGFWFIEVDPHDLAAAQTVLKELEHVHPKYFPTDIPIQSKYLLKQ